MMNKMYTILVLFLLIALGFVCSNTRIPTECKSYKLLGTADRAMSYTKSSNQCDDMIVPGWYRFGLKAGTAMQSWCPPRERLCGTKYPGWVYDEHPTEDYEVRRSKVCFRSTQHCCFKWSYIQVRKCKGFFVYRLAKPPTCNMRYCGNYGAKPRSECQNYLWLTDKDRALAKTSLPPKCDSTLPTGWYRFGGLAGSAMTSECVPTNHCGTVAPGWLWGRHPLRRYEMVKRQVCFRWNNDCCRTQKSIHITNCGEFFVYRLTKTPLFAARFGKTCSLRYCGNRKTGLPGVPTNIHVNDVTDTSAVVWWDRPINGTAEINRFVIYVLKNGTNIKMEVPGRRGYAKLINLLASTAYSVVIEAVNEQGAGKPTTKMDFKTQLSRTRESPTIIDIQVVQLWTGSTKKILITCKVTGSPPMSVTWYTYKSNVKVLKLKAIAQAENALEIKDSGVYECKVENRYGAYTKVITVSKQDIEGMAQKQKDDKNGVSFPIVAGVAGGLSFVIIILIVVVVLLCWRMRKLRKQRRQPVVGPSLTNGVNENAKDLSSFPLHSLKPIKGRNPAPLPPRVTTQDPNSEPVSYDLGAPQRYMQLRAGGQRSSDGYDYALHAYEVLQSTRNSANPDGNNPPEAEDTSKVYYYCSDGINKQSESSSESLDVRS